MIAFIVGHFQLIYKLGINLKTKLSPVDKKMFDISIAKNDFKMLSCHI